MCVSVCAHVHLCVYFVFRIAFQVGDAEFILFDEDNVRIYNIMS